MAQAVTLRLDGRSAETEVTKADGKLRVRLDDRWFDVEMEPTGPNGLHSLLMNGQSFEVYARPRPNGWDILIGTRVFSVESSSGRGGRGRALAAEPEGVWVLKSPLSGIVNAVKVATGDRVEPGTVLLVIESMKMNNELSAARGGTVTAVNVTPGQRVDRGTPLVQVE